MPQPKLSSLLNNCLLAAATPEIRKEVEKFAQHSDNGYLTAYANLKEAFSEQYQIRDLTWAGFHNILASLNPCEIQVILGPVLRRFMQLNMNAEYAYHGDTWDIVHSTDERRLAPADFITEQTEIEKESGRYAPLPPDLAFRFVFSPLGFALRYASNIADAEPQTFGMHSPVATIMVRHSGEMDAGHYERVDEGITDGNTQLITYAATPLLGSIIQLLENPFLLSAGMECLGRYVRAGVSGDGGALTHLGRTVPDILQYYYDCVVPRAGRYWLRSRISKITPDAITMILRIDQEKVGRDQQQIIDSSSPLPVMPAAAAAAPAPAFTRKGPENPGTTTPRKINVLRKGVGIGFVAGVAAGGLVIGGLVLADVLLTGGLSLPLAMGYFLPIVGGAATLLGTGVGLIIGLVRYRKNSSENVDQSHLEGNLGQGRAPGGEEPLDSPQHFANPLQSGVRAKPPAKRTAEESKYTHRP